MQLYCTDVLQLAELQQKEAEKCAEECEAELESKTEELQKKLKTFLKAFNAPEKAVLAEPFNKLKAAHSIRDDKRSDLNHKTKNGNFLCGKNHHLYCIISPSHCTAMAYKE